MFMCVFACMVSWYYSMSLHFCLAFLSLTHLVLNSWFIFTMCYRAFTLLNEGSCKKEKKKERKKNPHAYNYTCMCAHWQIFCNYLFLITMHVQLLCTTASHRCSTMYTVLLDVIYLNVVMKRKQNKICVIPETVNISVQALWTSSLVFFHINVYLTLTVL